MDNENNDYRPRPDAGAPYPTDYGTHGNDRPPYPSENEYGNDYGSANPYQQNQNYGQMQDLTQDPYNNNYNPNNPYQPIPDATGYQTPQKPKKIKPQGEGSSWSTFQIVIVIVISFLAVTFIGLFIWMFVQWNTADSNVQAQIQTAVDEAVQAKEVEMERDFQEKEKYPYNVFTGPSDYGSLSFEYPKTWSGFVARDVSGGGDFQAYFNPNLVYPVAADTINALRVTILDQNIDQVTRSYESGLKQDKISVEVRPINGENANVYTGALTNKIQGIAAVFKIRDKTAVVQTDTIAFREDFTHVLDTIDYKN